MILYVISYRVTNQNWGIWLILKECYGYELQRKTNL